MCGIAGYISYSNNISDSIFKSMLDTIEHRGPNFSNIYKSKNAILGHNRLKIIDLSDKANQPFHSHNNRYVIVYNGEVYNFEELAKELKQRIGIDFNTQSDTEVILELFSKDGISFLEKLNGMFSLAILDKENEELFLAVDRIGIKPLYFYKDDKQIAFASELKALAELNPAKLELNKDAINMFLHLGYIPAPHTIYNNIFKLIPGHFIQINKNEFKISKYWDLAENLNDSVTTEKNSATQKLDELLSSSIKYRLKSDVPYGVFLSGGIDSSIVAAKAVSESNEQIKTFTIGFKENKYNEADHAHAVAKHLNTNHQEFIVSHKDAIELVDSITEIYDEPFGDSSCLPTLLVSKMASKHVTVVLSGEGGDELFHGYGSYNWARRLSNPFTSSIRKPASLIFKQLSSRYKRVGKLLDYDSKNFIPSHIFSQEQYLFTQNELGKILTHEYQTLKNKFHGFSDKEDDFSHKLQTGLFKRKLSNAEIQALYDLQFYLPGDLLTKIDRATMHHSIEGRVPILDHRIIEFAINLDPKLKYNKGITKYLLKEVLYKYVPRQLFDRPKQGFSIPLVNWLKNELRYLIEDNLNEKSLLEFGIFDPSHVNKLVTDFYKGDDYLYNRIWIIIMMQLWLKNVYSKLKHAISLPVST